MAELQTFQQQNANVVVVCINVGNVENNIVGSPIGQLNILPQGTSHVDEINDPARGNTVTDTIIQAVNAALSDQNDPTGGNPVADRIIRAIRAALSGQGTSHVDEINDPARGNAVTDTIIQAVNAALSDQNDPAGGNPVADRIIRAIRAALSGQGASYVDESNDPPGRNPLNDRLNLTIHVACTGIQTLTNSPLRNRALLDQGMMNLRNEFAVEVARPSGRLSLPSPNTGTSNSVATNDSTLEISRAATTLSLALYNREANNSRDEFAVQLVPAIPTSNRYLPDISGQRPSEIRREGSQSLLGEILRVRAATFCKESKFSKAEEQLEEMKKNQKDVGLSALLLMAEVYIHRNKKKEAKEAMENIAKLSMVSLEDFDVLIAYADDFIKDKSYVRALVLLRILSNVYERHTLLPAYDKFTGIANCVEKMNDAVKTKIKSPLAINYGLPYMAEMVEALSDVNLADSATGAKRQAQCLYWIGINYKTLKKYDESKKFCKSGVRLLNKKFGARASEQKIYGDLLYERGMSCFYNGNYADSEKYLQEALDAYKNASDFNSNDAKRKQIKDTQRRLNKARAKRK